MAQGAIASQGGPENAIVFEPMPVKKAALWLAVTGVGLTEQPGAQIEARAAIYHSLSMPIAQFQAVFDALMGGSVTLMRGELRLDLGTAMSEIVPLELRFDRMSGELFTLQAARDPAAPHAMDVTLTNAVESALELRKLDAWIGVGGRALAATIDGFAAGATIAPNASQSLKLYCKEALPEGDAQPLFDFREVIVKPDPAIIWGTILDPSTPADYQKTIQVRAVSGMFEAPPDKPNDRILAILVQFETGGTVELTQISWRPRQRSECHWPASSSPPADRRRIDTVVRSFAPAGASRIWSGGRIVSTFFFPLSPAPEHGRPATGLGCASERGDGAGLRRLRGRQCSLRAAGPTRGGDRSRWQAPAFRMIGVRRRRRLQRIRPIRASICACGRIRPGRRRAARHGGNVELRAASCDFG